MHQIVTINFGDAAKWDESKHPRGKGEKGGQFVKKGMGGGPSAGGKVNIAKFVGSELQKGTSLQELAEKLKAATAGHINKQYVATQFSKLEKAHGLKKGALTHGHGAYIGPNATPPAPKPTPMPQPTPVAKPTYQPANNLPPGYKPAPNPNDPVSESDPIHEWPGQDFGKSAHDNMDEVFADPLISDEEKGKWLTYIGKVFPEAHIYGNNLKIKLGQSSTASSQPAGAPNLGPLPQPNDQSQHQKNIYAIALGTGTNAEKLAKIAEYPTVKNYPDGYTAKYAHQLAASLGGTLPTATPPTYTPTPTPTPTAKPYTSPVQPSGAIKSTKPSKLYKQHEEDFAKAHGATTHSWDAKEAKVAFHVTTPAEWNKTYGGIPDLKAHLKSYAGAGSGSINDALRNPEKGKKTALDSVHAIQSAFDEDGSEVKADVKMWRGTGFPQAEIEKLKAHLNQGTKAVTTLDGFTSCAFFKDRPPSAFAGHKVWLEILVKKGTQAVPVAPISPHNEGEVLLPHGQQFHVLEIEENWKSPTHGSKTRIRLVTM